MTNWTVLISGQDTGPQFSHYQDTKELTIGFAFLFYYLSLSFHHKEQNKTMIDKILAEILCPIFCPVLQGIMSGCPFDLSPFTQFQPLFIPDCWTHSNPLDVSQEIFFSWTTLPGPMIILKKVRWMLVGSPLNGPCSFGNAKQILLHKLIPNYSPNKIIVHDDALHCIYLAPCTSPVFFFFLFFCPSLVTLLRQRN